MLKDGKIMSLIKGLRTSPPVCMLTAAKNLVTGHLHFPQKYVGKSVIMDDGQSFRIFRHVKLEAAGSCVESTGAVFIVRFKFAHFSQRANRLASCIPIPLIVGFPGFRDKIWALNDETNYWQGMYQFESPLAIEAYRVSFVLGVMSNRAIPESLSYTIFPETSLLAYIQAHSHA